MAIGLTFTGTAPMGRCECLADTIIKNKNGSRGGGAKADEVAVGQQQFSVLHSH